jgi:hypothetical protein
MLQQLQSRLLINWFSAIHVIIGEVSIFIQGSRIKSGSEHFLLYGSNLNNIFLNIINLFFFNIKIHLIFSLICEHLRNSVSRITFAIPEFKIKDFHQYCDGFYSQNISLNYRIFKTHSYIAGSRIYCFN